MSVIISFKYVERKNIEYNFRYFSYCFYPLWTKYTRMIMELCFVTSERNIVQNHEEI